MKIYRIKHVFDISFAFVQEKDSCTLLYLVQAFVSGLFRQYHDNIT